MNKLKLHSHCYHLISISINDLNNCNKHANRDNKIDTVYMRQCLYFILKHYFIYSDFDSQINYSILYLSIIVLSLFLFDAAFL